MAVIKIIRSLLEIRFSKEAREMKETREIKENKIEYKGAENFDDESVACGWGVGGLRIKKNKKIIWQREFFS